jgi:cytochrome b pre-mRNA-processing protein 3
MFIFTKCSTQKNLAKLLNSFNLVNSHLLQNSSPKLSTSSIAYAKPNSSSSNGTDLLDKLKANNFLPVVVKQKFFDTLKEYSIGLGFQGSLNYKQVVLKQNAARLYLCIQYQIDYDKFFEKCKSPDVMYTWCLITFLHVWLINVALFEFGRTGLFVRNMLIQNMWTDFDKRARQLNPMNKKNKFATSEHLMQVFYAFLIGFDEGLLSDDIVLAGAVWRHIFEMKDIEDYGALAEIVEYIRKNVAHIDTIPEEDILKYGIISFLDFDAKTLNHLETRQKLMDVLKNKTEN